MKIFFSIILFILSVETFGQAKASTPLLQDTNSPVDSLFLNFINRSPVRYDSAAPILSSVAPWVNICPAGIITNPADPDQSIFYVGEFSGNTSVDARIAYYIIDNSNPYDLGTRQGTVLDVGGASSVDENGARFGAVIVVDGTIYYYYVGIDASYTWRICLATSTDGINFTKQGVVLDVTGSELSVSDPMISHSNGKIEMGYTVWSGPVDSEANHNPGTSSIGQKLATSTDFVTFTRENVTIIPLGPANSFYDNNVEGGQLFKFGYTYATFFNANNGPAQFIWSIGVGYLPWPNTDETLNSRFYIRSTPFLERCTTCWDDGIVAVPLLYIFPGDVWVMYYQATESGMSDVHIGAATLVEP